MAKFCGKCGMSMDDETGKCPHCDGGIIPETPEPVENQEPKAPKKDKPKKVKKQGPKAGKKKIVGLVLKISLALIGLLLILTIVLACVGVINIPAAEKLLANLGLKKDATETTSYTVAALDAEEYFEERAELVDKVSANKSQNVLTEAEAYSLFTERGFTQYAITTNYAMDGEFIADTEISGSSTTKHPIYQTYYVSAGGDVWVVMSIDGTVVASPVSYNTQETITVEVALSESKTVTSYDGPTNAFYKTVPNEDTLKLIVVDCIDAAKLDQFSIWEIDRYVA